MCFPLLMPGKRQFSIRVKDLLEDLNAEGFPGGHTPQICSALQTGKFLRENGLEIERVEGPPSKLSPAVVFHYRVADPNALSAAKSRLASQLPKVQAEGADAWAQRLTEKLRGLLKDEFAEYGGGEAFLRWVRSEDEDTA